MKLKFLIDSANIKDEMAYAYTRVLYKEWLKENITTKELQISVDNYCNNMADSFIFDYKNDLSDKETLKKFLNHINNIGANKPHSGHRFYESLYNKIKTYQNKLDDKNENNL